MKTRFKLPKLLMVAALHAGAALPLLAINETVSIEEQIGRQIPSVVRCEGVTFADFNMNRHGNAISAAPGEMIMAEGFVRVVDAQGGVLTQVVIGIAGVGGVACAYNHVGLTVGDIAPVRVFFEAPQRPGVYEIRIRQTTKASEHYAIAAYGTGVEPGPDATIGVLVVQ